jgi:hypothetical protein
MTATLIFGIVSVVLFIPIAFWKQGKSFWS